MQYKVSITGERDLLAHVSQKRVSGACTAKAGDSCDNNAVTYALSDDSQFL
jgi:hypothetical protein